MARLKQYSLTLFFVLAYLFPWIIWGTSIAEARGLISFHIPQSLAFWVGLNLATYIAAAVDGGVPAIKDILSRIVRWRVSPVWYGVALISTGLLSLIAILIHQMLGGAHQVGVLLTLSSLVPSLLFQIFFFLLTEESAWRGFALPRLQARHTALTASLILGMLWGLWHIPLVFIPGSFQSQVPFVGFVLSAVATTILMTWAFNHSRGSVLIAALFHAATDVSIAYSNVMTGDLRLFWIFVAVQCIAAVVLVIVEGAQTLARKVDSREIVYPV